MIAARHAATCPQVRFRTPARVRTLVVIFAWSHRITDTSIVAYREFINYLWLIQKANRLLRARSNRYNIQETRA